MSNYINIIKESVFYFPLVAAFLTIPYILYNYHRYGSLLFWRIVIIYSFIFYLLTAYFLVILPLPSIEKVTSLKTPYYNLLPLNFIRDIIKESGPLYTNRALWQFLFNTLMFVPFGIYLRYYFKLDRRKTLLLGALLSLFFEFTQLSGLYFYYPRPYRLFDVDDLLANSLGAILGHLLCRPLSCILPDRKAIDDSAYRLAAKVSCLRRLCALGIDGICMIIIISLINCFVDLRYAEIVLLLYFAFFFGIFRGASPGMRFVHITIVNHQNHFAYGFSILRVILFNLCYFRLPFWFLKLVSFCLEPLGHNYLTILIYGVLFLVYFGFLLSQFWLFIFNRQLIYEKLSSTRVISTFKI